MPPAILHASGSDDAVDDIDFDEPDIDEPEIDEPEIDEPEIDEPDIDEPDIDEPEIDEPEIDEPDIDEPDIDEPEIDEPEIDEPEIDQSGSDDSDIDQPDLDEPEDSGSSVDEPEVDNSGSDDPDDSDAADDVGDDVADEPGDEDNSGSDDSGSEDSGSDNSGSDDSDSENSGSDDSGSDDSGSDDSGTDNSGSDNSGSDDSGSDDSGSDNSGSDNSGTSNSGTDETSSDSGNGPAPEAQQVEEWRADLIQSQDPEFDTEGNPARRGELVALDLSPDASEALLRSGFQRISVSQLPALEAQLTTLRVPEGQSVNAALALARTLDPSGVYDLGHYYASPFETASGRAAPVDQSAPVHSVNGNLRIGLIDTAIRRSDLPQRVNVEARAFGQVRAGGNAEHGTAVASILVANGASQLIVANVFDSDGRHDFSSAQTIGQALAWLMAERVSVINVSLAGPRNAVLDTLVRRAVARGTVIVAAAGNGGPAAAPAYPAALPDVVAVTAVDAGQRIYRYANRGGYVRVAAYGVRVPVDFDESAPAQFTGTSFAAPLVAARIARCIGAGGRHATCIRRLETSAVDLGEPGRDDVYGFGFVD